MRTCHRCDTKMLEGFDIKVEGQAFGIKIADSTSVFAKRIEKPKVAICPECGEISLYIENIEEISK